MIELAGKCMMTDSDFNWLTEHAREVFEAHRGRWIAVSNGRVIGAGDTATEAVTEARKTDPDADFILEAIDHETDVIYGGL